jgi:predicted metal-binding membrane protein
MVQTAAFRREQIAILATLGILTAAAWALTLAQMNSMGQMGSSATGMAQDPTAAQTSMGGMAMEDTGQTVEPGVQLLVYLGMWMTMMTAMMLPSATPLILTFGTIYRRQREQSGAFVPTWIFVAGYLGAWAVFGAYAWGLGMVGNGLARVYPQVGDLGPRVASLAMLGAGLYQLTPLKQRCLSHCRSPLDFVLHHWKPGVLGALRMGAEHGVYCVGCCWVLMILLVTVGLASLPWMGLITLIIFAEKLLPRGRLVRTIVAASLLGLSLLTLIRPDLLQPMAG